MTRPVSEIMLMSDSAETRTYFTQLINQHFKECGIQMVNADWDGAARHDDELPGGIVLDAASVGVDTPSVVASLKALFKERKIPTMVLLGLNTDSAFKDKILSSGADDVVQRPIDDRELSVRIRLMLRLKAAEDAKRLAGLRMAEMETKHQSVLDAKERHYKRLVEILPDTILICLGGKIVYVNHAGTILLGLKSEDTLTGRLLTSIIHPESKPAMERVLKDLGAKEQAGVALIKLRADDGSVVQVEAAAVPFDEDDDESVLLVLRDVGDRTTMSERFRQSQRMEAVGQLAGGVAHDFNNILTTIRGYSDLMLDSLTKGDPLADDIREIKNATERAASLTRQLLAFSRRQQMDPAPLDLNRVVLDIQRMLKRMIGDHIDLVCELDPDLGTIKADRSQIEQVIMNLAVNARDAMQEGGTITIRTTNVDLGELQPGISPDLPKGAYVLLEMSDTGVGMSSDIIFHIFEPFFTTKAKDKGTGLGLSTVYGIVKQSGGDISVKSEPNRGTSFRVYLPIVPDLVAAAAPVRYEHGPTKGWETILLVEDDKTVRYLTKRLLERAGYRIIPAGHGGEALYLAEQHKGDIHLIVTDVVMPEMGGTLLVEKLAERFSSIKAILMSGYSDQNVVRFAEQRKGVVFLPKPFSYEELTQKVRRVLDGEEE